MMRFGNKIAVMRNARAVMKADAACRQAGLPARIIAVPPKISSECGMCIQLTDIQIAEFARLMAEVGIETKLYDYPSL